MKGFQELQRIGKALMLPIAVLPVAGLLLRLGQPDVLNVPFIAQAGGAVFDNLALLFAVGIAVGLARESNGVAGLAGAISYFVLTNGVKAINDKVKMGILAGIIAGMLGGAMYNRFRNTKLPPFLGFFGGSRFVPIITGAASLVLALIFGFVWPGIQVGIDAVGNWITGSGPVGAFVFGTLNRLLIPVGLHHILNNLTWFVFGSFSGPKGPVTGDLNRYFAGDPTAGVFMAGFYPVMMFGLPAAAMAIARCARPENRKAVTGVMLSAALTAFLTGITEPIEFAFMFVAPALYAIHAVLTGVSLALLDVLGVRHGFSFSGGAIDFGLNYGLSTKGWMIIPVGLAYAAVYYGVFVFAIQRFNLATPGREAKVETETETEAEAEAEIEAVTAGLTGDAALAARYIEALGGHGNIREIDACITRLRLDIVNRDLVKDATLRALGASGVIRPGSSGLQVVLGARAEVIAREMKSLPRGARRAAAPADATTDASSPTPKARKKGAAGSKGLPESWVLALGGRANIKSAQGYNAGRVRIELVDAAKIDEASLLAAEVSAVMRLPDNVVHLLVGEDAERYAKALEEVIA